MYQGGLASLSLFGKGRKKGENIYMYVWRYRMYIVCVCVGGEVGGYVLVGEVYVCVQYYLSSFFVCVCVCVCLRESVFLVCIFVFVRVRVFFYFYYFLLRLRFFLVCLSVRVDHERNLHITGAGHPGPAASPPPFSSWCFGHPPDLPSAPPSAPEIQLTFLYFSFPQSDFFGLDGGWR